MKVIGLTGGIGMGKSTVAATLKRAGFPVFDADAAVHALQAPGGRALPAIAVAFPDTVAKDAAGNLRLDRAALRRAVLADPGALRRIERIIHPLVRKEERRFLARARASGKRAAVLDVPLLLETGGKRRVDCVLVVSAPRAVQIARVRRRGRMTEPQIEAVIARQMPDGMKRRHADIVVRTGLSRFNALRTVRRFARTLFDEPFRSVRYRDHGPRPAAR